MSLDYLINQEKTIYFHRNSVQCFNKNQFENALFFIESQNYNYQASFFPAITYIYVKIMIYEKNYEKAIELINQNLNDPNIPTIFKIKLSNMKLSLFNKCKNHDIFQILSYYENIFNKYPEFIELITKKISLLQKLDLSALKTVKKNIYININ